ncbi:MAG: hybrid sensor histidine kinase/response regulator [bacterium]|nr:hybrid sensor histidine kinase/response regulator [bacterium]
MSQKEKKNTVFKILIVDDNPKNIQVAANILRNEGCRMAFAQNGEIALDLIRGTDFDLVLMDIMMPVMDGFKACDELKKDPATSDVPLIFLSAKNEMDDILKGFEKGAVDYITKPFNSAELLARVRTHLELNESRRKLKENNVQLRTLNATKDKFFSIIAHDLRNPMQSLMMTAELLKTSHSTMGVEKLDDYIDKFYHNTLHISNLLKNLLTWAQTQRGKIIYHPRETDIHRLVKENILLMTDLSGKKKLALCSEVKKNTCAFADGNMINTVIRNLLSNAIKFTPSGGTVNVTCVEKEDLLEVTVSDSGVGIPEETLNSLFKIDSHITSKGTDGEKGTGLGLILCKEFVQQNKGSIRVESTPGKGSRFTFSLPVSKE